MWRLFILFFLALSSCEGSYVLTGTVYEQKGFSKVPIDSVSVKVIVGKDWFRGQTYSDTNGHFSKMNLSTPTKATYHFIFEKEGFKKDTLVRQGSRGRSKFLIEHAMTRN